MLNDFVSYTSELEFSFKDIGATEVLQLLLYFDNDLELGVYFECIKLRNLEQTCVLTAYMYMNSKCIFLSFSQMFVPQSCSLLDHFSYDLCTTGKLDIFFGQFILF